MCVNKHKYENHIKFEVSLHFLSIWPIVRRAIVDAAAVGGLEDDSKDKWPPLRMSLLA